MSRHAQPRYAWIHKPTIEQVAARQLENRQMAAAEGRPFLPLPTLRPGETQGDILSKQGPEPFALVAETAPDFDARQRAEVQAVRDRAESEKLQTELF